MTIDDILNQLQARLGLEAETEALVLDEIRCHLEDAVAASIARGADPNQALREAASAFGVEEAAAELHEIHAGWGALDGVAAAALPVIFALVLRWLIFAPGGTADAWRVFLSPTSLFVIAGVAILLPLLRFSKRRYVIALWIFFWGLSLLTTAWPSLH